MSKYGLYFSVYNFVTYKWHAINLTYKLIVINFYLVDEYDFLCLLIVHIKEIVNIVLLSGAVAHTHVSKV